MGYPIYHSAYTAAQIEASIGKTPRIKAATRTWEIWDISTSAYVDTGVSIDTELFVDSTLTEAGYAADAKVTGDKIGELKSALEGVGVVFYALTPGYYIVTNTGTVDLTPVSSTSFNNGGYAIISCSPGDKFILTGTGANAARLWCFVDSTNKYISRADANTTASNLDLTAPTNAVKLIINSSVPAYCFKNSSLQDDVSKIDTRLITAESTISDIDDSVESLEEDSAHFSDAIAELGFEFYDLTPGYYIITNTSTIDLTPVESEGFANGGYAIISCSPGDKFVLTGTGASAARLWCFIKSDNKFIDRAAQYATATNLKLTAPANAAKLIINSNSAGKCYKTTQLQDEIDAIDTRLTDNESATANLESLMSDYGAGFLGNTSENMAWTWWTYPAIEKFNRVRNKVYWGFTTADRYSGVASYDIDTEKIVKNIFSRSHTPDDHNNPAVFIYDDGTILTAYSRHNEDNYIRIRKATDPENVERFGPETALEAGGPVSYAQIFLYNGTTYLFYRSSVLHWAYRTSSDNGVTWSDETVLIVSDAQYYCKFTPTTTAGVLRILMYTNPTLSEGRDANIRQAFFHLDNNTLYNSDNETDLGTTNVSKDDITILIALSQSDNTQRLFDCAVTAVTSPLVLYATYTAANAGIYKLYDSGTVVSIVEAGKSFLSYVSLGASFIDTAHVVIARDESNVDYVEIWTYSGGSFTKTSELTHEPIGTIPIRQIRPIVDATGSVVIWQRGFYGADYHSFNLDVAIRTLS